MNSRPLSAPDVTKNKSKDASTSSPLDRRIAASTLSSSNTRHSIGSSEIGESSKSANNRNTFTTDSPTGKGDDGAGSHGGQDNQRNIRDTRVNHRNHHSRASGGFLLSNPSFQKPSLDAAKKASTPEQKLHQRQSVRDTKGKSALKNIERRHTKMSSTGLGITSSPLAANVITAPVEKDDLGELTLHKHENRGITVAEPATTGLDVDSAQIVNLALNLSESRRNAARRNTSTPLPSLSQTFGEGFAGGSLRLHLQQQRRVSRNVSPKPNRGDRATSSSPKIGLGVRSSSPLQPAFDSQPDGSYQYHFSASTLARAEKAKNSIELMAQYRRLLQYVPPLKPQIERVGTSDAESALGSPLSNLGPRSIAESIVSLRPLGRPYNPLQYIRNRKVRARSGKAIDGEAQGFGDLEKVSLWVDQVSRAASSKRTQTADSLFMPSFSSAADLGVPPHDSPQSHSIKGHTPSKAKRPRIDWVINPVDLLADVFWLDYDDNKKIVEDRHGRKIFPFGAELKRPMSQRSVEPIPHSTPSPATKKEIETDDLLIDTKLPEFKSVKSESKKHSDSAAAKAKDKLRHVRDVALHHGHNRSARESRHIFRPQSRSGSDSSASEMHLHLRHRRSATNESNDYGTDILEKQMMEMIQIEEKEVPWTFSKYVQAKNREFDSSESSHKAIFKEPPGVLSGPNIHSRSESVVNRMRDPIFRNGSSGRASLEVPGINPRRSLDELYSTAPNSPETRAARLSNSFIPSIALDLSPPQTRHSSPTRTPISRIKSKIMPHRDRSMDRSLIRMPIRDSHIPTFSSKEQTPEVSDTEKKRRRSLSPVEMISARKTDESLRASLKKNGSMRKPKGEESGIRGLFKGTRNPVSRVGDLLWKSSKDNQSSYGGVSGFSTDESDIEDFKKSHSRESSIETNIEGLERTRPLKEKPELPSFTSPFEGRGRPTRVRSEEVKSSSDSQTEARKLEAHDLTASTFGLKPPPRIDVQNASPNSSPDVMASNCFQRDSSVSDLDSRRGSMICGERLNKILGLPGQLGTDYGRRNALPMTGLAKLDINNDRRPSIEGKQQWSISDRGVSMHRGPMTKREIARVKALLLSSGIKAKEINRRAAELKDLRKSENCQYSDIARYTKEPINPVPKSRQHVQAVQILTQDIQISSNTCYTASDNFVNTSVSDLLHNIENMQRRIASDLTPMTRKAADEADEVSRDLVTKQTLTVKMVTDKIDMMMRRRRRRFRWLRRGGWVLVEWALVGIMWYAWFMVVLLRIGIGIGRGAVASVRWLLWL